MNRKNLRSMIQQEISKMKEEMLLSNPEPGQPGYMGYLQRTGKNVCPSCGKNPCMCEPICPTCNMDPCICVDTHSHGYSLGCSECGEPTVMEEGCGCSGGSSMWDSLDIPEYGLFDDMQSHEYEDMPMVYGDNYYDMPMSSCSGDAHCDCDSCGGSKRGAYMAHPQLHKIEKYARELQQIIPDDYDLEDWMRSHISQIADDISEVYHKLEYKSHE